MIVAERSRITVGGLSVSYLFAGENGPPVVLLHGGGVDSAALSWRFAIGPLSRSYQVFAPDLPGYGESDKPDLRYGNACYVSFVGRFMDSLGIRRATLAGISMGGGASLGFALGAPGRVEALILSDSYGLGGEVPFPALSFLLVRLPLLNEAAWAGLRRSKILVRWALKSIFGDPEAVTDELVEEVVRAVRQPGTGRAFRSWQRNEVGLKGLRTDYSERLGELRVRTLIIHGSEDRLVPVSWAERAHRRLPASRLRVLEGCGHWPQRERPGEFNEAVLEFLGEV